MRDFSHPVMSVVVVVVVVPVLSLDSRARNPRS